MREELNPILAKRMLGEWSKIQGMKFWQYLIARIEDEEDKARKQWEDAETGTMAMPLMNIWLKLQGRAHAFRDMQNLPNRLADECEKIIKGEPQ